MWTQMKHRSREGAQEWRASVRASVRPYLRLSVPGFRPFSGKVVILLSSNLVYAFIVWVFRTDSLFGLIGPILAENDWKYVKMLVPDPHFKNHSHNLVKTCGEHLLGECSELIRVWATLAQFWPSCGQKDWKCVKMLVSDHHLKKHSCNPIQTWFVHLLGECSELILF